MPVISEALKNVQANQEANAIYVLGAELMAKDNRLGDAISLLEKGIALIPAAQGLVSLYQSCAELMAKDNRLGDAISLLEKGIALIPAAQNLSSLYQSAIELAGRADNYFKAETLAVKGLTAIPKSFGRHKIAETALRVFSVRRDTEAIQRLLSGTGLQQLDPPQVAFADYLLARLSGNWERTIEIAHKGRADIPNYFPLRVAEADACLALGQVQKAGDIMKDYQVGEGQVRDNPAVWFKTFVSLIAGRPDEAQTLAPLYAPNDFDSDIPLDEDEMLRLWSVARNGFNSPVEAMFEGLVEYQRRNAEQSQTKEKTLIMQTPKPMGLLVIATEWDSRHGGLSTFNRDLCTALADTEARVVCYVPEVSEQEKRRAREVNVEIVEATKIPGIKGIALLSHPPELPEGFVPDVIIGHDRITGAASVTLAKYSYPGTMRVLFIHTSPEEIEWHKELREDSTSAERAALRKGEQLGLAEGCDLIVAVGPRLNREFGTDLYGAGNPALLMELTPGLPQLIDNFVAGLPPGIRCLVLGRAEDYELKGLDLAAKAFGRVVANWKHGNPPKLVVRGAPIGTDPALRQRLAKDSATGIDIVIRHYSADETEIRNDLRESSLVLMPSRKEGFGLVGLEAIACGIPTLISDQSGLAETLRIHAPNLASEWILPVTGEDTIIKWENRIETLLQGRQSAFASAAALRDQLSTKLDWSRVAVEFLEKLGQVKQ